MLQRAFTPTNGSGSRNSIRSRER